MEKFKDALQIVIALLVGILLIQSLRGNPKLDAAIENIGLIKADLSHLQTDLENTRSSMIDLKNRLIKSDEIFAALSKDRNKLWLAEKNRRIELEKGLKNLEEKLEKNRKERIRLLEKANSFKY
ncbi:hypothetical protein ACT3CE_15830 [Marinifilum sp. RC60d5]|uniref:hypothetical protein n=1 Tax=Marinifilum sp. RC60d5 TaxID=3458414 RepID=UPI0040358277